MKTKKFAPSRSPEFCLIDFKAVVRHALNSGSDPDCLYDSVTGRPINTAKFAFRTFFDLYVKHWLEEFSPVNMIVAHDSGYAFRTSIYSEYKANRLKDPANPKNGPELAEVEEELFAMVKSFFAAIGATQIAVKGVEADDILKHLVDRLSQKYTCVVYTVDADLLVLTNKNTAVSMKLQYISADYTTFQEACDSCPKNMWGYLEALCDGSGNFYPEISDNVFKYLCLYKSICGDKSDNYGGVKGLGDAKWKHLAAEYEMDGLQELQDIVSTCNWSELKEVAESTGDAVLSKMYESKEFWRTCWQLAELHPESFYKPFGGKLTKPDFFKRVPNKQRAEGVLTWADLMEESSSLENLFPQTWIIDSDTFEGETDLKEFAQECAKSPVVAFDYETVADVLEKGNFNSVGSEPTGVSFCFGENLQYAFYLTTAHKDSKNLPVSTIGDLLESMPEKTPLVAHNMQFESVVSINNLGLVIEGSYDTAVMNSYVDENQRAGLKACSKRELNYDQQSYDETLAAGTEENVLRFLKDNQGIKGTILGEEVYVTAANFEEALPEKYSELACRTMADLTVQQVESYGIDDSIVTAHLYQLYWLRMQLEGSWDFYANNEPAFIKRTALSQTSGTVIDLQELDGIHQADIKAIEENTLRMRELLSDNCKTPPSHDVVSAFIDADAEFSKESLSAKLKELPDSDILGALEKAKKTTFDGVLTLGEAEQCIDELLDKACVVVPVEGSKEVKLKSRRLAVKALQKADAYKSYSAAKELGTYKEFEKVVDTAQVAPTAKNINEVCKALDLPEFDSMSKQNIVKWQTTVRDYDFETDHDGLKDLNEDQLRFFNLFYDAAKYFAPSERKAVEFQEFNKFCCKVLKKPEKVTTFGTELSTGSPKQMQVLLYVTLGMPVRLRSKVQPMSSRSKLGCLGSPASDALAFDTALAEDCEEGSWQAEVINCIRIIKKCETRISLYHVPYKLLKHPKTGLHHPSIKACGTVTRRPTCSDPNILQVSKHQDKALMRGPFKPRKKGDIIVSLDFAGQELRILASETRDKNLLSAYLGKSLTEKYLANPERWEITTEALRSVSDVQDIHSTTASGIVHLFGTNKAGDLVAASSADVVAPKMNYQEFMYHMSSEDSPLRSLSEMVRKKPAKTTNFLIAYDGSPQALANKLIIPLELGKQIMQATHDLYPGIAREQANTVKMAKLLGYSETAYGNRRHATDDLFSNNSGLASRLGRQLFNARIQGCAADILKIVMANCEEVELYERLYSMLIAPVYDELTNSVPHQHAAQFVSELRDIMNILPPGHAVPMMADVSIGPDWRYQKELGPYPTDEEVSFWAEVAASLTECKDPAVMKKFMMQKQDLLEW